MHENMEIFRSLCQIWKPEWQGMVMAELEYEAGERRAPLKIQVGEDHGLLWRNWREGTDVVIASEKKSSPGQSGTSRGLLENICAAGGSAV